jgi:urease accessory protein UreH
MAGRVSRGEAWRFASLAHVLRLRVDKSLSYLERYKLTPADGAPQRTWIAGDASYLSTTLVRHAEVTRERVDALHRSIAAQPAVDAAVDLVAPGLAVARLMACDGASFSRARASYREMALRSIFGAAELATRK